MKSLWKFSLAMLPLAAVTLIGAQPAATLVPAQSEVIFQIKQMGVPVEGRFRKFEAQVAFDPKKPETGSVLLRIDTASATMGSAEVDTELPKPTWFAVAKFPQATFQSSAIKGLGGGKFEVSGKLNIKGQVRDITLPVALTAAAQPGGPSVASGNFAIKRVDFLIGQNEWADTSLLANEVQVRFKLALTGLGAL